MKTVPIACLLFLSVIGGEGSTRNRRQGGGGGGDGGIVFPQEAQAREAPCVSANEISGTCKPLSQCIQVLSDIQTLGRFTCTLPTSDEGVCCPSPALAIGGFAGVPQPAISLSPERPPSVALPQIATNEIDIAGAEGDSALSDRERLEEVLFQRGLTIQQGTPEDFHQNFLKTVNTALLLGRSAEVANEASQSLQTRLGLTPAEGLGLAAVPLQQTRLRSTCPPEPRCPDTRFRTMDGSCNNLANKNWGKSFTAFERLLQPDYADGISKPRISPDGSELPSARLVSATVIGDLSRPHPSLTRIFTQYGKFLDHDLTLTAIHRGRNNTGIKCCDPQILADPTLHHPECFEIQVPNNDPFYGKFQSTCMEFVRSLSAPRPSCNLGPREQMNQLTSFIDGSQIYGSTQEDSKALRTGTEGKLRTSVCDSRHFLPFSQQELTCTRRDILFEAGNVRVNQVPQLAMLETIFLRLHNRITDELGRLKKWNDEQLYQETRRIVGAILQHITYNEFVVTLLGMSKARQLRLLPQETGFSNGYDKALNPSILNEFATAAYRLHTLVQRVEELHDDLGNVLEKTNLSATFGRMGKLVQGGNFDHHVRGGATQACQEFDNLVTRQLTNHLFQGNAEFGLDLASLNIQRGRDHGLKSYTDYRKFCRLPHIKSFHGLRSIMAEGAAALIRTVYKSVDDIDLWVGGTSERPMPGAVVGPTFACIIGEQFRRTKFGDRFWYENGRQESSFSEGQLAEIRKISLARVLCDVTNITSIQPLVFHKRSKINKKTSCSSSSIPSMDFTKWRKEHIKSKRRRMHETALF